MTHDHIPGPRVHVALLTIAALLLIVPTVTAQVVIDYNDFYRFPISAGAEFRTMSPTDTAISRDTAMTEISVNARYPLPFYPMVQPFV